MKINNRNALLLMILFFGWVVCVDLNGQPIGPTGEREKQVVRTDLLISGVYPHLTTYGIYSQNGGHYKDGHNECGIGAIVPWAGKLWMVNYAPHQPGGSEHKLFSIEPDLKTMTIHPESVGGTPAGRMIHRESNQLLIAHYLIDATGKVRVISPNDMPMRVTAIARHLKHPETMVYYIDMEGSIWEANVKTLKANKLFEKPVPGWHGKGGYTGQGRLIVSNNGEKAVGNYKDVLIGGKAESVDDAGVLAEYDGDAWRIIERRQYTDVTGPSGITGGGIAGGGVTGGGDGKEPVWAIGWDRRSLRLKLLEEGKWSTYLLPKATFNNDAKHGWYTEWPRIRAITGGRWMMDMHGMFYDFPAGFSTQDSSGIAPIGSHLRYVPDFCDWNGKLVLATDETSIQGNKLAGQPQSNLWFGDYEDLREWGPASGFGGPWVNDVVKAGEFSDPFLVAGFDRRVLHLAVGGKPPAKGEQLRASDQQVIHSMPIELAELPRVTIDRGDWRKPAAGFRFTVNEGVTVYLAVDKRGGGSPGKGWQLTKMEMTWGSGHGDRIYARDFVAGEIRIPGNEIEHTPGSFGMPHAAFVFSESGNAKVMAEGTATVTRATTHKVATTSNKSAVEFTIELDVKGNGKWIKLASVEVANDGYVNYELSAKLDATWLRVKTNRDCVATVYLHQTTSRGIDGERAENRALFGGLADVRSSVDNSHGALLYAAKRNRNLRVITSDEKYFEFTKAGFEFVEDETDSELKKLLSVEAEFEVDDASVILMHKGRKLRLPKGNAAFDRAFEWGWPRGSREVESERHLANFHGTFYEIPLITNGKPPAFDLMRPVASHSKMFSDFCSWNGLLVLAGVKQGAEADGHVFVDKQKRTSLWLGGIDDLWKLGKPIGKGGPWKQTRVKADVPSDAYLMTGYDQKSLRLVSDVDTEIMIEIDFDHQSGWHQYKTVKLKAGVAFDYDFPEAFSAHWIRFTATGDCTATAQLEYR